MTSTTQPTTPDLDDSYDESRDGFHQLMDSVHLDETFIDPLIDADRLRTLRQVLAAIEDPEQRAGGLGWETARDIVQRMIDASAATADVEDDSEPCGESACYCRCGDGHVCGCDCERCPYCQQLTENCDCDDEDDMRAEQNYGVPVDDDPDED